MKGLFAETKCLGCPVLAQALRILRSVEEKDQPKCSASNAAMTAEGIRRAEGPWYGPLEKLRADWTLRGVSSPALGVMDELILLGTLGKTQKEALSMVYRSIYGASMTGTENAALS